MERSPIEDGPTGDDEVITRQLGYKQELYRGIHAIGAFSIGFSNASTWLSVLVISTYALTTGGPGPFVWGFLISFLLNTCVACVMAEICSAFPQAGSVYNWAGQLASEENAAQAAYWAGIINWLGYVASNASWAFMCAVFFSDSLELSGSSSLSAYAEVGISLGIMTLWAGFAILRVDSISILSTMGAVIQISALFVIVGCLLSSAPSLNTAEFVFFDYYNDTGFSSQAYIIVISIVASSYSFSQYDGSAHMAEESVNARVTAPYAVINTVLVSGITGFAGIMAILFSVQSISDAISSDYGNAAIAIIVQATPYTMQLALCWLLTLSVFASGIPVVTTTGRITYALLRDHIIPGQDYLADLNPHTQSPIYAILIIYICASLLLLLPLVNEVAFYSFCSITAFGSYASYAIPIALKLGHDARHSFPYGPVNFGSFTIYLEVISLIFLGYQSIVLLFPYTYPVTASNMNYSIVIIAGIMILGQIAWVYANKYTFKGPLRHKAMISASQRNADLDAEESPEERQHLLGRSENNEHVSLEDNARKQR